MPLFAQQWGPAGTTRRGVERGLALFHLPQGAHLVISGTSMSYVVPGSSGPVGSRNATPCTLRSWLHRKVESPTAERTALPAQDIALRSLGRRRLHGIRYSRHVRTECNLDQSPRGFGLLLLVPVIA